MALAARSLVPAHDRNLPLADYKSPLRGPISRIGKARLESFKKDPSFRSVPFYTISVLPLRMLPFSSPRARVGCPYSCCPRLRLCTSYAGEAPPRGVGWRPQTWSGPGQREKNLDSVPVSTKHGSFLLHRASKKALIKHPLARCGTRSTSSLRLGGTDVGCFWNKPYLIPCGAIDSHDPLITLMGTIMAMMVCAYLRLMSYLLT